jgi:hypothetical protein
MLLVDSFSGSSSVSSEQPITSATHAAEAATQ